MCSNQRLQQEGCARPYQEQGANDSGAGKSLSLNSSCKHSRAIIDWGHGK